MKIAICEDDASQVQITELYLKKLASHYRITGISKFASGESLVAAMQANHRFDIYLLDIELPGISGVDLAALIGKHDPDAQVAFISGYPQYISQAFSLHSAQYLLKPIKYKAFARVIHELFERYERRHMVYVMENERSLILPIHDIIYIEFYYGKITIITTKKKYQFHTDVKKEKKRLRAAGFLQTHQSYFVNPDYVKIICQDHVCCDNDLHVPVSTRQRRKLLDGFNDYLSSREIEKAR